MGLGGAAALVLAAGCVVGGTRDDARSAHSPAGAPAMLHRRVGYPMAVELIMVEDSLLTFMHHDSVKQVRWTRLTRVVVPEIDDYERPFGAREREAMARVSRFPYGASAQTMADVLRASGQSAPALLE